MFLITVNYKHFDNKHTHYIYSNEYFDTKIIGLLKPQTDHFIKVVISSWKDYFISINLLF